MRITDLRQPRRLVYEIPLQLGGSLMAVDAEAIRHMSGPDRHVRAEWARKALDPQYRPRFSRPKKAKIIAKRSP